MTPAQELRAAVKTLRCDHSFPVLPPLGSLAHPGDCSNCGVSWGHHELVADDLKPPLAAWLETEAKDEEYALAEFGYRTISAPALRAARVINGGAS